MLWAPIFYQTVFPCFKFPVNIQVALYGMLLGIRKTNTDRINTIINRSILYIKFIPLSVYLLFTIIIYAISLFLPALIVKNSGCNPVCNICYGQGNVTFPGFLQL